MAILLGLLVALTYGSGDFCGGIASTRSRPSAVVIGSFGISLGLMVAASAAWGVVGGLPHPSAHDLLIGAVVGCIGPIAVGLLYRGLALGRMSVVAPITAVVAAIVPFVWGLLHGERPSTVAIVGVAVALVAVALISGAPTHPDQAMLDLEAAGPNALEVAGPDATEGTPLGLIITALVAGLGFGVVFILLSYASADAGLWPLVSARLVAVVVSVVALTVWSRFRPLPLRASLLPAAGAWAAVAAAGALDITANAIYLSATQRGLLSIVAVLSSLYPASTVVLARVVLNERLHRTQLVGLLLAAGGVVAMAAS